MGLTRRELAELDELRRNLDIDGQLERFIELVIKYHGLFDDGE